MYARVYEQIFSSSIMEEDLETRYVWFCLLALSDRDGFVDMTIPAIARRINLHESVVIKAIDKFMMPDPSSRTDTQEGRRLEKIRESFGWKIINYIHYRDLRNEENRREYMREYMRDKRNVNKKVNSNVNKLTVSACNLPLATTATATATATTTTTKKTTLVQTDKISFDFTAKKFINLNNTVETFKEKYPALDIDKELLKMEAWLISNPKNRKSNYLRFINNWL